MFQLARVLSDKIIRNHTYQDGNKRVTLYTTNIFLKINRYQIQEKPIADNDMEFNRSIADAHVAISISLVFQRYTRAEERLGYGPTETLWLRPHIFTSLLHLYI